MPPRTQAPSKTLVIQPLFYEGRRLKEIGDKLMGALYPLIEGIKNGLDMDYALARNARLCSKCSFDIGI